MMRSAAIHVVGTIWTDVSLDEEWEPGDPVDADALRAAVNGALRDTADFEVTDYEVDDDDA